MNGHRLFSCVYLFMKCLRCQNEDPRLFAQDHGVWYCRRCIGFSRLDVGMPVQPANLSRRKLPVRPVMNYSLTEHQAQASAQALSHLKAGYDVFMYAATGAGKTECTLESICYYLKAGKKVCFAISRRQVVLEIRARMQSFFPDLNVIAVCQGYTDVTDGDLIVCTTHQLYRYPYAFDLLILDEVDAFPYAGNALLESIAAQSCIGQILYLSATPDETFRKAMKAGKMKEVCLFERPHHHPIPVPQIKQMPAWMQVLFILSFCHHHTEPILVFVPTKADCIWMAGLLRCPYIHSGTENKDEQMEAFRDHQFSRLVCTTLLERGITVANVQVLVYQGQHAVFTSASLIQIFGRVGRSFDAPQGEAICLCRYADDSVKDCVRQLQQMNDCV